MIQCTPCAVNTWPNSTYSGCVPGEMPPFTCWIALHLPIDMCAGGRVHSCSLNASTCIPRLDSFVLSHLFSVKEPVPKFSPPAPQIFAALFPSLRVPCGSR